MPVSRAYPTLRQGNGGFYNFGADYPASSRNLRRVRAAKARVRAGVGSGIIACGPSDSNTRGTGTGTGSVGAGSMQGYNGWPVKLAAELVARDPKLRAQSENFFGSGGIFAGDGNGYTPATYDDRIALSGSGIVAATLYTIGGRLLYASAAGAIAFTPKTGVTQCDLYYVGSASAGTLQWSVDGGATTNFSCQQSAGTGIYKLTIPLGALGSHTVTIGWVSGGVYILGMDCYDATAPSLRVWNWGWHGSTSTLWLGNSAWSPVNAIPSLKPDLVIMAIGTNDWSTSNNLSVATSAANKQTLMTAWQGTSDTLLLTVGPTLAATMPALAAQKPYIDADYGLAAALGVPLLDEWAAMGDETFMQAAGLYNTDLIHKTAAGNAATADLVANAILAA